ncbi:MAG: NAD(P)/FAD-dependent oxidoreductase [Alphaproteobacteria bacterium]|nr:NAD(P)/FAD-dependent oxidoreductase [Alphaproteobacteria bacterium]
MSGDPDGGSRPRPRVVIVGGGFGGIAAARALARAPVDVVLVDKRNHHLFQPLLYQVATAALSPGDVAEPIRGMLAGQRNVEVLLARATAVEPGPRVLRTTARDIPYDHLILAAGATHSYFGHDEWAANAPGLKTLDDALEIRQRILLAFERAEWTDDPDERRRLLSFVVIGAGPTGVELAGAVAEIATRTLERDFRRIDPRTARVTLVEGADAVLRVYPDPLPARAARQLEGLGVQLRLGRQVVAVDEDGVVLGGGDGPDERIEARTVLWGAGVAGAPVAGTVGVPLDRAGRVIVGPDLTVPGHPELRVIGDLAHFAHTPDGQPLPGVAQVALQMGRHAGQDIARGLRGQPTRSFRYRDLGSMATIGRSRAVAWIGRLKLSGIVAWWLWLFVHLMALVGFRNRVLVLIQWAWSYWTWDRSSRLIRGERHTPTLVDRGGDELVEDLSAPRVGDRGGPD